MAIAGSVLLRNTGILPLDFNALGTIAVIGHNARHARTQGGGSATVLPKQVSSPLDALSRLRSETGSATPSGRSSRKASPSSRWRR